MSSFALFFKQIVHLNLNLAVIIILAWVILGRRSGSKTSLTVWSIVLLRCIAEPFLCPESSALPLLDFTQQGFLSVGLGLGWTCETLLVTLGLGSQAVSVGDLLELRLGTEHCAQLGILFAAIICCTLAGRFLQLLRHPGSNENSIVYSDSVKTPHISGWFRPSIQLPRTLPLILEESELRAVIAHERAHIEGGDHRLFALLYLLRGLCWLILPLKIVLDGIEQSIEQIRDKQAASEVGRVPVARALVKLVTQHPPQVRPAFSGQGIGTRLQALTPGARVESKLKILAALFLLGAVIF